MHLSGKEFQAERIAGAKALKQERCGGLEKQQGVWLGQSERGSMGDESREAGKEADCVGPCGLW